MTVDGSFSRYRNRLRFSTGRIGGGVFSFFFFLFISQGSVVGKENEEWKRESVLRFADHLFKQQDFFRAEVEYRRFAFTYPGDDFADDAMFKVGLCLQGRRAFSRAVEYYRSFIVDYPDPVWGRKASYQIARSFSLEGRLGLAEPEFRHLLGITESEEERDRIWFELGWCQLRQTKWRESAGSFASISADLAGTRDYLRRMALGGEDLPRKNPVMAGALSAVLPGSGRAYCQRYGDGFFSFAAVIATIGSAFYYHHTGNRTGTYIMGGLGGVLYGGNVLGSVVGAQLFNQQTEEQYIGMLEPYANMPP
jgi:hypothetical protein